MRFCRVVRPGTLPALAFALSLILPAASYAQEDADGNSQDSPAATNAYNTARAVQVENEDYELAESLWLKFLEDHPGDSRVANVHYNLGIAQWKQDKFQPAAGSFQTIVDKYTDFDLMADTLFNLGWTHYRLGRSGNADAYTAAATAFDALAAKHADSPLMADALYFHGESLYYSNKKKEAAEKYQKVVDDYPDEKIVTRALFALGATQADLNNHEAALKNYDLYLVKVPDDAEVTQWRGDSLFALKQYAEAAKAFASAAAAPDFATADYATLWQAYATAALEKYAEAATVFASLPTRFKDSAYTETARLEAGKNFYWAGDYTKAQASLQEVRDGGGKLAFSAAHWTAQCLLKVDKPADALKIVEPALAAVKKEEDKGTLLLDQADAIHAIPERRAESVALYAALAEEYPNHQTAPQALYMAAFAAMNLGEHKTALAHAEKFLSAHAGHDLAIGVRHVKAESLLWSKQFAEAEELLQQLLRDAPGDQDAGLWKVHLGASRQLQQRYAEAIDTLQSVLAELEGADLVAEAHYRIGCSQSSLKQFDAAVKSLEASLAAAPQWNLADDAHLVAAYAYQQKREFDRAKEHARKAITDFPGSARLDRAHYRLGQCCRLSGDMKTAVAEYQLVFKGKPSDELTRETLYGLGWAQVGLQDYAAAEKTFSQLIDGHPGHKLVPRARYGRGLSRQQLKQFGPAAEDIEAVLAADPPPGEESRARHVLGLCQKGLKQYEPAIATFEKLLEENPDYDDAVQVTFQLGLLQRAAKQEEKAAATFAKLAEDYPEHALAAESFYVMGNLEYDAKDYKKAAVAYYKAMNAAVAHGKKLEEAGKVEAAGEAARLGEDAAHKLGWSYFLQDDFANALKTFAFQKKKWPDGPLSADAVFMQAECHFRQKEYQEALDTYKLVKDPKAKNADVLTLLHAGNAAGQLKEWQESLDLLTKCVDQFPDSPSYPQALYEQGWALHNLDRIDDALANYEKVLTKSTGEPAARAHFQIGQIHFLRKQHTDAIARFVNVATNYPYPKLQSESLMEAGRCYEVLRKLPQAIQIYQKLLEKFPESDEAPQAQERLQALQR